MWFHPTKFRVRNVLDLLAHWIMLFCCFLNLYLSSRYHAESVKLIGNTMIFVIILLLCGLLCIVALLSYCSSYNHLLLVLYQFPVCPLQCAWLLCYATVPLTTTFFWFSISSLCVHYNVHGCSAICYCSSYNHLLLVLYQFPVCQLQCAWLLCYATVPLTTTFLWFSISSPCVCYKEVNDLTILLNHHALQHY